MSKNCQIMQRMKENYEKRSRTFLTRRTPVIIRLDGKAFHTYTRGLEKPFDEGLIEDMTNTAKYLCESIQGAKCAYVQSDEISILLTDYDRLTTDAWFDYNVQKVCSISASLATGYFNKLRDLRNEVINNKYKNKLAFFDSRCFNIPKEEVSNYFLARQKDAVKNSISMLAQSLYSHKELHKKNQSEMQELCFQKGVNWNDLHWSKKRGSFIVKSLYINGKKIISKDEPELGDLCYQPSNQSTFYPDKRGRLLEYAMNTENIETWCEVPIETVRNKWEIVETPLTFTEQTFKQWT